MKSLMFALVIGLAFCLVTSAQAFRKKAPLATVNCKIHGTIIDFTNNHGCDHRMWSTALQQKRDLYVYLPPGYDPTQKYPVVIWLHGLGADERQFVKEALAPIDQAIACGRMPATIIVIPDGTKRGKGRLFSTHSSFLNTRLGCYEDYLMGEVWSFVTTNFPIRPERQAHVLAGVSLGGGSAFHHALKRRDRFGVVLGIYPPVNVRWVNCRNRYFGNFDPCCWGWRQKVCWGHEPVGKFFGVIKIPIRRLVYPLYGRGRKAVEGLSRDNPIEIMMRENVQPGELSMFIAYGKNDEFNIDAQVESFAYVARSRGLGIHVLCDPNGSHNLETAKSFISPILDWLAPQLVPYSPPRVVAPPVIGAIPEERMILGEEVVLPSK